ncbi:unnamed protein product [Peniophora sp. CBMAI 1063]|nr:unnamed protein product [Peniophora sp. CBMAI 1063]
MNQHEINELWELIRDSEYEADFFTSAVHAGIEGRGEGPLAVVSVDARRNGEQAFLRTCRKVSGMDLRRFADEWIYGSGFPTFTASFNRKKMAMEIHMRQDFPAYEARDDVHRALSKPVELFEGQTIRIHEADGTPYEHVLDIRAHEKRLDQYQAAQAAAEGDVEAAEAMRMVDISFGLDNWKKERERHPCKIHNWTEDDENVMNGATYEWIRKDADFEWILSITFSQPDLMWVSQLQGNRDVVVQLKAVNALAKMPANPIISSTLTKTVLVTNYLFRIRCEARRLCSRCCAIRKHEFLGLFHLFGRFLRSCYNPEAPDQDLFVHSYVPRPNDFSDIAEYLMRRALTRTIAQVRSEDGNTPAFVRKSLVDLLNLVGASLCVNAPEKGELAGDVAQASMEPVDARLLKEAIAEVDRYRNMDRLISSPHNSITVAALAFRLVLSTSKIVRYVLAVIAHDSSRVVRRRVARNAGRSLALFVAVGESRGGGSKGDESRPTLIEDGTGECADEKRKKGEVDALIKALRKDKDIGKGEALREIFYRSTRTPTLRCAGACSSSRTCSSKEAKRPRPNLAFISRRRHPLSSPQPSSAIPTVKVPVKKAGTPVPPSIKLKLPTLPQTLVDPVSASPSVLASAPVVSLLAPRVQLSKSRPASCTASPAPTPAPVLKKPTALPPPSPAPAPVVLLSKSRPPKSGPKAQNGGMGIADLKTTRSVPRKLTQHKATTLFRQLVDPVRDQAPGYFDIIKQSMDLSNMRAKLEAGLYPDRFAFEAHFSLMIRNAKTYNVHATFVAKETSNLESYLETQWCRISKMTEKAQPAVQARAQRERAMPPPPVPMPIKTPEEVVKPPLTIGGVGTPIAGPSSPALPATPTPAPKPKPRKPSKPTPAPPLPDDGTPDLFEEVLAIEKERGAPIASSSSSSLAPPGKMEKDTTDDDEPSKKRGQSRNSSVRGTSSIKLKTQAQEAPAERKLSCPEKRSLQALMNTIVMKDCVVQVVRLPREPVDPIMLGIPTCFDVIPRKGARDLRTIRTELEQDKHEGVATGEVDMNLMVNNAIHFNNADSEVGILAMQLKTAATICL